LFEIINQFKTSVGETKITPSNKLLELSFRTIPFYYNVQPGLLNSWNYFKTKKNKQDNQLSYHTSKLAPALHIQNPLNYNIDGFDFFRIEGHQGKDYQKVLTEIDTLKTRHGLPFDVKALSVNVNSENLNIDDYLCEFEDLKVLLSAWTAEQECVLAEVSGFFSGFSTAVPGENVKEPQLNLNRKEAALEVNSNSSEREKKKRLKSDAKGFRTRNFRTENKELFALKSEVVSENLTTEKDALGSVLKIAIEETKGGSVNDIIARSKVLVEEKVTSDDWKSKPEVKTFVIDQSIELMAHAHILSQKMPNALANVSVAQVDTYKATMANLCALVKKMKASYQTVELSVGLKAFIGIFINQLSIVCCSGKKLEILLEEINKRKESILVRLQLSKFVEKNTGLEHLAGVQPGGTFVLVYLNKVQGGVSKDKSVAGKLEAASGTSKSRFSIASFNAPESVSVFKEAGTSKKVAVTGIENLRVKKDPRIFERFIRPDNLSNNTVIADFSLPYMCCSDCAPVNFIIAKSPVSLRLEKDEFCLGKDKSPLLFEVAPADGVIKANPETAGLSIEGAKLMLDAALFPDEMLGQPILFTVNDQITQTQLTVHRAVQFDFEVPESPTSLRTILFQPSGKLDGATFLWSFGDDNLSTEQNPRHTYKMPVNEDNKVTVSLTVTAPNGICQDTVEHDIEFKVEETRIEIEKKNYCENDKESYPFVVIPSGAKAKIEGDGVRQQASGDFVFIPADAELSGEISFKLNGKASGISVTVHKAPVPKFTPVQVDNKLVITNESAATESFIWVINDKEFAASDTSPHSIELTPNSPTLWSIQLQAINKICGKIISKVVRFETSFKEEEITIDLEKKTFCENDKTDYKFEITPAGSDAKIAGSGVRLDTSGNFVFNPTAAEPGDITFTINGVNSALTIEVKNAPLARFTPNQIENQLVLTNKSANAESYVWVVNGAEIPVNNTAAHTIQLTPNSPNLWNLQLHASSKLCGTNSTKLVRFQTEFIGEPVNTCVDETKAAVLQDSKSLVKLETPVSDFVTPTWNATSRLYGGTAEFNKGVLNDVDDFLSGKNNESLSKLFSELLSTTSNIIVEIDGAQNKEELNRLIKLFELQLKLFYNIIGCQDKAVLKQFESIIRLVFERIIQALQLLKELQIILPDSLKVFIRAYAKRVTDLAPIIRHLKEISDQKLI